MTNYTDIMKFAQEMTMIIEHFRKLQCEGFHFNIIVDNSNNVVLYDSDLAGKFFIKPVPVTSPIDLTTRTVYECRFQDVEYSVATLSSRWDPWNDQLIVHKNRGQCDIIGNIKSTQMINPLHSIEEVEKEFFKYVNDLKVKMKVFQIKQIGADEDDY